MVKIGRDIPSEVINERGRGPRKEKAPSGVVSTAAHASPDTQPTASEPLRRIEAERSLLRFVACDG